MWVPEAWACRRATGSRATSTARASSAPGGSSRPPASRSRRRRSRTHRNGSVKIEPITAADFAELATWRYDPPYDFYDGDQEEPNNPERYFAARNDDGEMIGFYYYEP